MKNFVSLGRTVDFTASANLVSGQAIALASVIAIAKADYPNGSAAVGDVEGVFNLPKVSADVIAIGERVFLTSAGNITKTEASNTYAGKAWSVAGNGVTRVDVKINS